MTMACWPETSCDKLLSLYQKPVKSKKACRNGFYKKKRIYSAT
jgi:hypothetical protein